MNTLWVAAAEKQALRNLKLAEFPTSLAVQ